MSTQFSKLFSESWLSLLVKKTLSSHPVLILSFCSYILTEHNGKKKSNLLTYCSWLSLQVVCSFFSKNWRWKQECSIRFDGKCYRQITSPLQFFNYNATSFVKSILSTKIFSPSLITMCFLPIWISIKTSTEIYLAHRLARGTLFHFDRK